NILEAPRQLDCHKLARLRPALDGNLAATRVDADHDPARIFLAGLPHQRRVLDGHRAEDDAAHAFAEPHVDGGEIADAAAELHGDGDRAQDRLDRWPVDRPAGKGTVEIDDVQPRETLGREGARLRG